MSEPIIDQAEYRIKQLNHVIDQHLLWDDDGKDVVKAYVDNGDLEQFIESGTKLFDVTDKKIIHRCHDTRIYNDVLGIQTVLFYGANPTYDTVKHRWEFYLNWVLEDPSTRGLRYYDYIDKRTLDKRWFLTHPRNDLFSFSYCFTQEDWSKLFHWIYGEQFSQERVIPMKINSDEWQPRVFESGEIARNSAIAFLISELKSYLFIMGDEHQDHVASYFEPLIEYVLPLIENIPAEYFAIDLIDREQKNQDGENTNKRVFQASVGGLFSSIVAYQEGFNFLDCPELSVRDQQAFERICQKINDTKFPKQYHELMDYVKEHRENFYYVRLGIL